MKTTQGNMFVSDRMQMTESIELTIQSMNAYGPMFDHWCIAWSGGKDSTTVLTLILWIISSGKILSPKSITVFYADTRLELTPLSIAAYKIMEEIRELGITVEVVMAPLEKRFLPYILGRGVPPPNNNTFRWCTRQIKIDPMKQALAKLHSERGKVLMITGVRQGESAVRDGRISMSCSKDGAECGQGWYQQTMPEALCDTLAPILHWRVCHVWEWLKHWAPLPEYGDWSTAIIADAYGGDEAEENNARTGCVGCPLTEKDTAIATLVKNPNWAYLQPLLRLKGIYRHLREPKNRKKKTGINPTEKNAQRMGPLTMEARKWAFDEIMSIQNDINNYATIKGRPTVYLINEEEAAHIKKCWVDNLWPNRWDGTEPTGDTVMDVIYRDGTIFKDLFNE